MAAVPDQLTVSRNRDLKGIENRPVLRWALLTLLGLFVLSGLLNTFGQKPHTSSAVTDGAELEVYSPERLRSGLFFMSRFTIRAEEEIEAATLVLDPGWLEGITLNSTRAVAGRGSKPRREDRSRSRASSRGDEACLLPPLPGQPDRVRAALAGRELQDGETPLLHIDRTVTIFP